MRGARKGPGAWVLVALLIAGAGQALNAFAQDALTALLPAEGAVAGWSRDGQPQEFVGDNLFTYIDGGAEIYQEYGFRRVVVQDFKSSAGKSVSLEIFEMASPEAAYGIFSFKRSGQGRSILLGTEAELEDYYLNFWKGRYVATLTGFDSDPATLAGLQAVAAAVDAKITDRAAPPELVAALPGPGLKPGSVKYLKGILGLNNIYPFFTARGLGFRAAVKGNYADGSVLIVLDYGSDADRARAWTDLRAALEAGGKFKRLADQAGKEPVYQDPKGRFVAFAESGPRLKVGIGSSTLAALNKIR